MCFYVFEINEAGWLAQDLYVVGLVLGRCLGNNNKYNGECGLMVFQGGHADN